MNRRLVSQQRRRNWIFYSGCNRPETNVTVEVFRNTYSKTVSEDKSANKNDYYVSQR